MKFITRYPLATVPLSDNQLGDVRLDNQKCICLDPSANKFNNHSEVDKFNTFELSSGFQISPIG
jgi:hypothetical protein